MNLKIKGKTNVDHWVWVTGVTQSFSQRNGSSLVDSQLVIKNNKVLVWNFDSETGSKEIKRETCSFVFEEIKTSEYEAHNGDVNQRIMFYGKRGWDGSRQVREALEISSFDNFETAHVYLNYFKGRSGFCHMSGYHDFSELTEDSQIALRNLYESLDTSD